MRIANSNISMYSARSYSEGVRVTSRSRISSRQTSSPSSQRESRERSTAFEYSSKSFSGSGQYNSYTNDGKKKSYSAGSFNIERQATRAKLKMIEKEERAKEEAIKLGEESNGISVEGIKNSLLDDIKEEEAKLIKKIVEAIRRFMEEFHKGKSSRVTENDKDNEIISLSEIFNRYGRTGTSEVSGTSTAGSTKNAVQIDRIGIESVYEETYSYVERETTAFLAEGSVTSADGRKIDFQMQMDMSREYSEFQGKRQYSEFKFKDPLVMNLSEDAKDISKEKFDFDLDGDGEKEKISFAGRGSGFLAIDKNGDGKINDGTELFGTRSGDGFKDLAEYDEDGNGWIDENDKVFMKLLVWSKDEDGNDELVPIAKKGIGAIYLGKANTEFSLKDKTNNTHGIVRQTGIYLKENGEAGAIKQIDLAV